MSFVKAAVIAAVALAASGGPALLPASGGPAAARPASVNLDASTVFAIGPTDNYVAEYNGSPGQWTFIGGPAKDLYAGSAGVFATDPTSGDIFQYDGTPGEWTQIGGPGNEFAEAAGHLYGLGPNDAYVAEYNGTPGSWTIIRNIETGNIYGGTYGLFAMAHDGTLDVLKYNGTPGNWSDIGFGPVSTIAVGVGAVYAVSLNGENLSEWSGSGWVQIGPPTAGHLMIGLHAGGAGVIAADEQAGQELKYNGTPYSWSVISSNTSLAVEAISVNYIYAQIFGNNTSTVDVYSGSGSTWTTIGGNASPPLAAGD